MKVKELIKILSGLDQETHVRLAIKGGGIRSMYKAEIKNLISSLDDKNSEEYLIAEGKAEEYLTWHDVINIEWTKPD